MKTLAALIAVACLATGCAGHLGQWPAEVSSARSILQQPVDDQKVLLRGYITEKVRHEKYLFSDDSGRILVDIDDDEWPQGQLVPPDQLVEIYGEVDLDHGRSLEIEVKRIARIPATQSSGTGSFPGGG